MPAKRKAQAEETNGVKNSTQEEILDKTTPSTKKGTKTTGSSSSTSSSSSPVVPFKKVVAVKRDENLQLQFAAVADYLLNHTILLCGSKLYRLVEIEFYMVSEYHNDCYAHKAPEQKENLIWYFHRTVPGIDLTFGGGDVQFGGILLRSVADLIDGTLIEGTSNILGLACRNNGCSSKETLMPLLAPGLAAVDDAAKVEDFTPLEEAKTSGSRVLPQKVKAQLTLIHDRTHLLGKKHVYSSPRVSLGVKNTPGLGKYHMLMAHYRFLTQLDIKAGKPNMVLGLRSHLNWDATAIAAATGCKKATVEKYIMLLETLEFRKLDQFPPCRSLLLDDYFAVYKLVHRGK